MKKGSIYKMLTVLLATSMVLLTGCGNSGLKETATKETKEQGAVTEDNTAVTKAADSNLDLSIMWWGSDERHAATEAVLDLYTKETGATFTAEYTGWDGYWSKLPVLAASNSMTDVLQMDAAYIHQYIDSGQLADLTNLIDLSGLISEEEIENYKIGGKLYGVPLSRNGQGIVYSKTVLDEYGIVEPVNGWTWDEMIEWARTAKEKVPEGIYPLYDVRNMYISFQEYVQTNGGKKTLEGNEFNFSKDAYTEFMELYNGLVADGICPPTDVSLSNVELDPINDNFLNKKVLLRSVSIGSVSALAEMLPDDELKCISLPQGEGGSGWCQSTIFFSIGANSKNIEEAAAFIQYFISNVEAGKTLKTVRGLPLSDEVYDSFSSELNEYQLKSKEMYDAITAEGVKSNPYWSDVPTLFTSWATEYKAQTEAVMLGETSIAEAAAYLEEVGVDAAAQ